MADTDKRLESIKKLQELKLQSGSPAPFNKGDADWRWQQKNKIQGFDIIDELMTEHLGHDWVEKPSLLLLVLEFGRGVRQYQDYLKLT